MIYLFVPYIYFLILAVITQILNPIVELAILEYCLKHQKQKWKYNEELQKLKKGKCSI